MSTILERIQILIQQNNDSATAVFEKIGIRKNALSEWKKGKGSPSVDAIIKIAQHYEVSTDFLLCGIKKADDLNLSEQNLLSLYNQLSDHDKIECIGFIKGYIAARNSAQNENS